MSRIVDLKDPRYLSEVGWFLQHEKYKYDSTTGSYTENRLKWSAQLLTCFLQFCDEQESWIRDKCVVSIGCGCNGDLAAWPALQKIAIDPLL